MATTTNYGWTTPDDTALVKDGASAIRSLGTSVDTTTKALNPSTTLGDIEYRSSTANTNTRLGIGSTGQVLTVSGGVPAWGDVSAGGMTLISTTTLTGASVTLSSIPGTYNDLYLVVQNYKPASDAAQFTYRFNADATANRHRRIGIADSQNTALLFNETEINTNCAQDDTNANGLITIIFPSYANTTTWKRSDYNALTNDFTTSTSFRKNEGFAFYNQTTAITSLSLFPSSGNFTSGTALLYGVK